MNSKAIYTTDCLRFLKTLKKNNNREWFAENKQRYEDSVRQPSLELITRIRVQLEKVSPFFPAVAKKVGGSLMRIHRDTRFGKDKTPYKTNVGIHFRHEAGSDVHAPGFYFHIEPGQCFVGAGCWRPDSRTLSAIRQKIDQEPTVWQRARDAKSFKKTFTLAGDSLKTSPRDYSKDHPLIEDLKRKDFIGLSPMSDDLISSPDLIGEIVQRFRDSRSLMRFLCEAAGVPF